VGAATVRVLIGAAFGRESPVVVFAPTLYLDVKLPAGSVDLAIMVDVYHELAYPYEVMASLMKALKPGGGIVFVEYKAEDSRVPIKPLHKMSEAQIKREAAVFALDWERTVSTLPWHSRMASGTKFSDAIISSVCCCRPTS
jgi:SAM-dependent methyltransferase